MSTRNKQKRRGSPKEGAGLWQMPKKMLLTLILTLALGCAMLLPATAVLLSAKDPGRLLRPVALCLSYLTALFGGMIAAKCSHGRSPLLFATALGVLLALVFLLGSALMPKDWCGNPMGGISHLVRLLLIPAAFLGAAFATRRKKAKRHHH